MSVIKKSQNTLYHCSGCSFDNAISLTILVILLSESRFQPLGNNYTEQELVHMSIPQTTQHKANWALKVFDDWRLWRSTKAGVNIPTLLDMSDADKNEHLSMFVQEARKKDGSPYPGKTLMEMICSLQKHLELKCVHVKFLQDKVNFSKLQHSLDVKMKEVTAQGIGVFPDQVDIITFEIENDLWEKGILGDHAPLPLFRAVFYLLGLNFSLRSGQEHRALSIRNFKLLKDSDGEDYLFYQETISKTYKGGLKDAKKKPKTGKAFQNKVQPERCVVKLFQKYTSLCPDSMLDKAFYVQPLDKVKSDLWYKNQAVGHNTLGNVVKVMMSDAGIDGRFTNHSLRSSSATRMFQAGIPEQLIKAQTGHSSDSVRVYKRPNEDQLRQVSSAIQSKKPKTMPTVPTVSTVPATTVPTVPTSVGKLQPSLLPSTSACEASVINVYGGNVNITLSK